MLRPTWAEIDLDNFCENIKAVASITSPSSGLLAVIKADGYGCGAVACALAALTVPAVKGLAVATPEEALELRDVGVPGMILVLGPSTPEAISELVKRDISVTITDIRGAQAMERAGLDAARKSRLHLKVDTGMSRLGFRPGREIDEALAILSRSSAIQLEGVYTHFAAADEDEEYTRAQWALYRDALNQLQAAGLQPRYRHVANSAAILWLPESHLDLVRPGIMLFGSFPGQKVPKKIQLKPVMSLKSRVAYMKRVPAGTNVGYGRAYTASEDTAIATVPIGYADGYPRHLSNIAPVIIGGKKHRLAGRVCMDQIMVDTGQTSCQPGDEVILIGEDGSERITVDEIASLAGTIPHEILTRIGKRVPRTYRFRGKTYTSTGSLIEEFTRQRKGCLGLAQG
ncbi:MAG TPA: alanine racemase [Firmicutes bacterium]|nr:alanine racemase [Candidatus Fermentithermobacillaceae bacterium]